MKLEEEVSKIPGEPSHQAAKLACESEAVLVLKIKVWLETSLVFQLQHEVAVNNIFENLQPYS